MKDIFTRSMAAREGMSTPCTSLNREESRSPSTCMLIFLRLEYLFVCMFTRTVTDRHCAISGFVRIQRPESFYSPLLCNSFPAARVVSLQIVFNPPTYPNFHRFLALLKHSVKVPRGSVKCLTTSFSRATRKTHCASLMQVVARRPRSEKPSVPSTGIERRSGCIPTRAWVFSLLLSFGRRNGD
jgi:hypothetical protein